jgi:hypothetical protein
MSNTQNLAAQLAAPFAAEDLKTRPGRGGMTYTYADVRAIDTRLDEIFTPLGWSFSWEVVDLAKAVVRGRLIVELDGKSKTVEECGYPNMAGQDDEPLKSAVSDSRRRAAAALGIARGLYAPDRSKTGLKQAVEASKAPEGTKMPTAAQTAQIADIASDFANPATARAALGALVGGAGGACPVHGTGWSVRPAGTSKVSGKAYAAFYTCAEKAAGGGFCKERPSMEWVKANPIRTAQPEVAPQDPNNLSDLPF